MTNVIEIKNSDLFQDVGRKFHWERRMSDQEKLIERIHEANKDILNPNAIEITHVADELKEFCHENVASIVFIEYVFERLQQYGVVLT